MTSGGRLQKLARTRQIYTGEPFHVAKEMVRDGNNRSPLSTAPMRQAYLEAEVFAKLCSGGEWWPHPFGISSIQARVQSATAHLDSHTTFHDGTPYSRSAHALEALLPEAEPGIQVNGVVGLRVVGMDGRDLHLTLTDGDCHLILRGTAGVDWKGEIDERWNHLRKAGFPPLWREQQLTDHEVDHIRDYPRVWSANRSLDWLGSALLRRLAMVHTSSTAHSVRSWVHDDEWVLQLDTVRGVELDHDAFLSRLLDPIWGIPLRIRQQRCSCDPRHRLGHDNYLLQCTYHLEHTDDTYRGGLQLRFRHGLGAYTRNARATLASLGAAPKWLDRVLPVSSPDVMLGASDMTSGRFPGGENNS
ncbi:hypothetical protein ACFVUY_36835 [Kitasatospora sp. NPDC058063]|uniref:hypothetical protein n=1 Tax=unclassified Kitasatospora TaxID=2633591 RepID=UPI0036D99D04